jgi:hypothetical protein
VNLNARDPVLAEKPTPLLMDSEVLGKQVHAILEGLRSLVDDGGLGGMRELAKHAAKAGG